MTITPEVQKRRLRWKLASFCIAIVALIAFLVSKYTREVFYNAQSFVVQKFNISPSNALGTIGWQAAQPTILNDWSPTGLAASTRQMVNASDNQGTLITGIDSSAMQEGDELELCNAFAPTDAGVVAFANEDSRSLANNRILVQNTGRFGLGIQSFCSIANESCVKLRWTVPDPVGSPSVKKWLLLSPCQRPAQSITQMLSFYPSLTTGPLTGTINDFNFGNVDTADSGPQGYSTTIAVASNGQSLPQATINVVATTGFSTVPITTNHPLPITVVTANGVQAVNCTGTTGTTFTGCSGGTGAMSTGGAVQGGLCLAAGSCYFDDYSIIRVLTLNTSGATITGMHWTTNSDPQGLGPTKTIINYGPGPLTLPNQSASSAAANRFLFPNGDLVLPLNSSVTLIHDAVSTAWQPMGVLPSGSYIARQVFTASGTYTPTIGTKRVILTMCGQGGGGGGAQGGTGAAAGGGGGGGDTRVQRIDCSGTCTGGAVTIANSGGTGGTTAGGNGVAGSAATIVFNGSTISAGGGAGGIGMTNVALPATAYGGGLAVAGSIGADYDSRGTPGTDGIVLNAAGGCTGGVSCGNGGNGGSSPFGAGGLGQNLSDSGQAAGNGNCAGGSGGSTRFASGFVGGAASGALVIVDEFN